MSAEIAEILLATHNGARYVREQIDSILAQTDARWHLTLSDDASTDGTREILDAYAAEYPDRVTHYRSGRRFGSAREHFFHLMERCDAAYMLFCDQDDVWFEDKVGRTMDALLAAEAEVGRQTPVLVFSDQRVTDENAELISDSLARYQRHYTENFDYRALLMQNVVTGGAMGINRALAEMGARCADVSRTVMHDWWLAVVAARFGKIVYLSETLGDYRQHGDNEVGAKDVESAAYLLRTLGKLGEARRKVLRKKQQAGLFASTYAASLGDEDIAFLKRLGESRSGPGFYWRYRAHICGAARLLGWMLLG